MQRLNGPLTAEQPSLTAAADYRCRPSRSAGNLWPGRVQLLLTVPSQRASNPFAFASCEVRRDVSNPSSARRNPHLPVRGR